MFKKNIEKESIPFADAVFGNLFDNYVKDNNNNNIDRVMILKCFIFFYVDNLVFRILEYN